MGMLSPVDIRRILRNDRNRMPVDDFRLIDSWAEYEKNGDSDSDRPLKYLFYEIEVINPDNGQTEHLYKAIKLCRIKRLPRDAKESLSLMDMHSQILTSVAENRYNLITVIANIIEPEKLGLLFLYGVQGVGRNLEDAKERADNDYAGLCALLQGTYRTLHFRSIIAQECEWLREKMFSMEYMTMVRGIPKANQGGENAGNKGVGNKNLNPNSQGTLEELIAGMVDHEYVIEVLSSPVYMDTLKAWQTRTQIDMTNWNGQLQGTKSLSANISMPMMYMANASTAQGWSHAYTDAKSVSISNGESFSTSLGHSVGHSLSETFGNSFTKTSGSSITHSSSTSHSVSNGSSVGTSIGHNTSFGTNTSRGTNISSGTNTSVGTNRSTGTNQSVGSSTNTSRTVNVGQTNGLTAGHTSSRSTSSSTSQSHSSSSNWSDQDRDWGDGGLKGSYVRTDSVGDSEQHGVGQGNSTSANQTESYTASGSFGGADSEQNGNTSGYSGGTGALGLHIGGQQSTNHSMGHTDSYNVGGTQGSSNSNGTATNITVNNSTGLSNGTSYAFQHTATKGESNGWTSSRGSGTSEADSLSQSQSRSITNGYSEGFGNSYSNGSSQSFGTSQSSGTSQSTGSSQSSGVSQSTGNSSSVSRSSSVTSTNGVSNGTSVGQSQSASVGESYSKGSSNSTTESVSNTQGTSKTTGTSDSHSLSNGTSGTFSTGSSGSMGLAPSIGYSKSYQWLDQQVKDILELLEFQNERIKYALRGSGAFYTYVYIACPNQEALSAAKALAKSTWQNENAMVQPLQVLNLTTEEQKHLLYHFSAFSNDVTREDVGGASEYKYCTVLMPNEFVAYTHLPRISEGGIYAEAGDVPHFASPSMLKGDIYMGTILSAERYSVKNGYNTGRDYRIDESQLMHGYFTGASRSGKTVAAMRFVAELTKVRRKKTGKRLRIVCMDPKRDWRALARFVEPDRFRFYSMGNPNFHPLHFNPCKIPRGVIPQTWVDVVIEIYCRAYGLLERGKQLMAETFYSLYQEAGVFDVYGKPGWEDEVPKLSSRVTFAKAYERMNYYKISMEDGTSKKGRGGNDTKDAYARLLERLSAFSREFSVERRLFGEETGLGVDELIGEDDVTVLESKGLESTFKNFIFGVLTAGFYRYALAQEGGFLAPDQYETVLVIEEANEVLTGNDAAGSTNSGNNMGLSGQSEFEQILDQSAGWGLFIFAITQKIADMPKSIIANAGLVFAGKIKTETDINVVVKAIAKDPRYDDRDIAKWFPRSPIGWFVCQSSRAMDFLDAEPVLVKIAMLPVSPPTDLELEEILTDKEIRATISA